MESTARYKWSDASLTPELKAQIRMNVMALASEVLAHRTIPSPFVQWRKKSIQKLIFILSIVALCREHFR